VNIYNNPFIQQIQSISADNKYTHWYCSIIIRAKSRANSRAQAKSKIGYNERHHIVPESFFKIRTRKGIAGWLEGDAGSAENLVYLSAKEHFICHRLLTKMVTGVALNKCHKALEKMLHINKFQDRVRVTAQLYAKIRKDAAAAHSIMLKGTQLGEENPFFGKSHTDETKKKISDANRGRLLGKKRDLDAVRRSREKLIGRVMPESEKQHLKDKWAANRHNRVGENHPMFGVTHSDETRSKMRKSAADRWTPEYREHFKECIKNRVVNKKTCPHCGTVIDPGNYAKLHGDKCKTIC